MGRVLDAAKETHFNSKEFLKGRYDKAVVKDCQMVYFHTKKPIWVNFAGPCNGKYWFIL
jgi:hypothetical protein